MSFLSKLRNGAGKGVDLFTVEALQNVQTRKLSIQALNMRITSKVGTSHYSTFVRALPTNYVHAVLKFQELDHFSFSALHASYLERTDKLRKEHLEKKAKEIPDETRVEIQKTDDVAAALQKALRVASQQQSRLDNEAVAFKETEAQATQKKKSNSMCKASMIIVNKSLQLWRKAGRRLIWIFKNRKTAFRKIRRSFVQRYFCWERLQLPVVGFPLLNSKRCRIMSLSNSIDLSCSSNQPGCSACLDKLNAYAEESSPIDLVEALAKLPLDDLRAKQQKMLSERAHVFVVRAFALQEFNEWDEGKEIEKQKWILETARAKLDQLKAKNVKQQQNLTEIVGANEERERLIQETVQKRIQCEQDIAESNRVVSLCQRESEILLPRIKNEKTLLDGDKKRLHDLKQNNQIWSQCVIL